MDPSARKVFNDNFTPLKYERFLTALNDGLKQKIPFRRSIRGITEARGSQSAVLVVGFYVNYLGLTTDCEIGKLDWCVSSNLEP